MEFMIREKIHNVMAACSDFVIWVGVGLELEVIELIFFTLCTELSGGWGIFSFGILKKLTQRHEKINQNVHNKTSEAFILFSANNSQKTHLYIFDVGTQEPEQKNFKFFTVRINWIEISII